MAAVWGRAWRSRIVSSTARGGDTTGDDDGGSLPTGGGGSTTSGTTYTTWSTSTSDPVGEAHLDLHPFITLPTALVVEEENAEELDKERVKKLEHIKGLVEELDKERVKKLEHIKGLVVEFCGNDCSALERWLSELDIGWVLQLAHVSESARSFISGQLQHLARSWILALLEITKSISICCNGRCGQTEANVGPPASKFERFVKAILSKMLPFVHAVVATRISVPNYRRGEPADEKLQALIDVRDALSTAEEEILSSFRSSTYCIGMRGLLELLEKAIWETFFSKGIWDSSWGTQESPEIHLVTRSVLSNIKVLWANYGSVNRILHDAFLRGEFVPENENVSHLTNLIVETVHALEEKLTRNSQAFPDEGLRLLFMINNYHFILRQLHTEWPLGFPMPELAAKIDDYVNSFIQVSWAPVLKCLHNPTPRCFTRHSSPLPKFESKFHTTYNAQKLWKVPEPEMRQWLRKAIVHEVISVFTEFLKDNSVSTSRVTRQEMKTMLEELFEG